MPAAAPLATRRTLTTARVLTALGLGAAAALTALPVLAEEPGAASSLRLGMPWHPVSPRDRTAGTPGLSLSTGLAGNTEFSWRLIGNYELPRAHGLRATGGMIGVSRRTAFGSAALLDSQRWDGGMTAGWIEGTRAADTAAQALQISVPYAGIGYSSGSTAYSGPRGLVSSSWSFNVDLGVMALAPRSSVRFGSSDGFQSRLDDLVREMRLTPMLQLGVSYSF